MHHFSGHHLLEPSAISFSDTRFGECILRPGNPRGPKPAARYRKSATAVARHSLVLALIFLLVPATIASAQSTDVDVTNISRLSQRIGQIRSHLSQLAGRDSLLDSLHFRWFDRPYARATLAIVAKTTAVLERELRLRRVGNDAIADEHLSAMLIWARGALARVSSAAADDVFRPHRLRVTGEQLAKLSALPALFGFIDASTSTRHSEPFGDLDLLAAAGGRIYPRIGGATPSTLMNEAIVARAARLGIAAINVRRLGEGLPGNVRPVGQILTVQPATLAELIAGASLGIGKGQATVAVIDPAGGEPAAASLARRALARGAAQSGHCVATGWAAPWTTTTESNRLRATAAVMWVHAMEGQSLGLLRGWRDLRDGSGSPYKSLLTDPATLEVVAHTALDVLRVGKTIRSLNTPPRDIAIAIDSSAIDGADPNLWAPWIVPFWQGLLDQRITFDVLPARMADRVGLDRYKLVIPLTQADRDSFSEMLLGTQRRLKATPQNRPRPRLTETDGTAARQFWMRSARDANSRLVIAVANLSSDARAVNIVGADVPRTAMDVVSNESVAPNRETITFAPWQVRLLLAYD